MKRNDYLLTGAVFILALVWFLLNIYNRQNSTTVSVYKDRKLLYNYSLSEDKDIYIKDADTDMHIIIKNGEAKVVNSNCPDKLCVNQKGIKCNNEIIVCLPNKVYVKTEGTGEGEIDEISY